jgi:hypothetical protein
MDTPLAGKLAPISVVCTPAGKGQFTWLPECQPWRGEAMGMQSTSPEALKQGEAKTSTPLRDAARFLLEHGAHPSTPIILKHAHANHAALKGTVGAAAAFDIKD